MEQVELDRAVLELGRDLTCERMACLRAYLMRRWPGAVLSALGRSEDVVDVAIDLLDQYERAFDRGRYPLSQRPRQLPAETDLA